MTVDLKYAKKKCRLGNQITVSEIDGNIVAILDFNIIN